MTNTLHAVRTSTPLFLSGISFMDAPENKARDPVIIERRNLVNISKLIVKELMDTSVKCGRMLDSDHMTLQHFFIVLEHVLRHGIKPKKGLLGPKKELWDILQIVEKLLPDAQEMTSSVRELPTVKTHMGRARAWLRLALMQKKLADYLQVLIENREDVLTEYFEQDALMMSEEAIVIVGLLVGLNVIDCNLCIKGEDLDCELGVIDFSLYLRSSHESMMHNNNGGSDSSNEIDNMTTVLDQKNYIEELNRHLNATVGNLQANVDSLTTTNALMKEDLDIARNKIIALMQENAILKAQRCHSQNMGNIAQKHRKHKNSKDSFDDSLDTEHLDDDGKQLLDYKILLEKEQKLRQEAEKELNLQVCLKAEMEVAMKLLEKDIHEKQDTIISLRKQLEDIKLINLEMYKKLQECEEELTQKAEVVSRLQSKTLQIGELLNNLQKVNHNNIPKEQQSCFIKMDISPIPPFRPNKNTTRNNNNNAQESLREFLPDVINRHNNGNEASGSNSIPRKCNGEKLVLKLPKEKLSHKKCEKMNDDGKNENPNQESNHVVSENKGIAENVDEINKNGETDKSIEDTNISTENNVSLCNDSENFNTEVEKSGENDDKEQF